MSPVVVTISYPLLSEKEWLRSLETNFKLKVALKFDLLFSEAQCRRNSKHVKIKEEKKGVRTVEQDRDELHLHTFPMCLSGTDT